MMARCVLLSCALIAWGVSGRALAQTPSSLALRDAQARLGALRAVPAQADVHLREERVTGSCSAPTDAGMPCRFTLHARLEYVPVEAAAPGVPTRARVVTLYASTEGFTASLAGPSSSTEDPSTQPLSVTLAPGVPVEVTLSVEAHLARRPPVLDGLTVRHFVFADRIASTTTAIAITRSVEGSFASRPSTLPIAIEPPPDHHVVIDGTARSGPVALSGEQLAGSHVLVELEGRDGALVRNGGPMLGLGATIDRGFRARLGYEVGLGDLVVIGVAGDLDVTGDVVLGGVVELAPGFLPNAMAIAFGVGGAARVHRQVSGGLRLQGSLHLAVLGFVASFDYFPDDRAFTSALFFALSL